MFMVEKLVDKLQNAARNNCNYNLDLKEIYLVLAIIGELDDLNIKMEILKKKVSESTNER